MNPITFLTTLIAATYAAPKSAEDRTPYALCSHNRSLGTETEFFCVRVWPRGRGTGRQGVQIAESSSFTRQDHDTNNFAFLDATAQISAIGAYLRSIGYITEGYFSNAELLFNRSREETNGRTIRLPR